ncbi:hypothetical protein Tco_1546073 [Tanacetum coccineum]
MLRATNYYFVSDRVFSRFLKIIDDNEDEHVVDNIADKGVVYDVATMEVIDDNILVSSDNVSAMEVVDDSILVSNDNIGAKEETIGQHDLNVEDYIVEGSVDGLLKEDFGFEDYLVDVNVAENVESLKDTVDNVDNGKNADNVENGVVRALKSCVGVIQSESLGVNDVDYTTTNAQTQVAFEGKRL